MGEDRRVQDVPGAPFFRGWARPGLVPPGVATYPGPLDEGETLDAISGHPRLVRHFVGRECRECSGFGERRR